MKTHSWWQTLLILHADRIHYWHITTPLFSEKVMYHQMWSLNYFSFCVRPPEKRTPLVHRRQTRFNCPTGGDTQQGREGVSGNTSGRTQKETRALSKTCSYSSTEPLTEKTTLCKQAPDSDVSHSLHLLSVIHLKETNPICISFYELFLVRVVCIIVLYSNKM